MSEKQQRLVYAIIEFLKKSIEDGTVKSDDREGLEIAIQCIGEAFSVDPSDQDQSTRFSIKPATLQSVFDIFVKTRDKNQVSTSENKEEAEEFKKLGNSHMSDKKYDEAIESYGKAIALDTSNPVYYSNRAAAYSSKGDHVSAVGDAEKAISLDPKFAKAYHRLGHAQYSLSDFRAAASAFERGLQIEPDNLNLQSGLENALKRSGPSDDNALSQNSTQNSSVSDRGPGGAGLPDLASFMNNPQMMAMAQQLMSNGGLANLMQNPAVANMMDRVRTGDMPPMSELMNDPSLRQLANQFAGAGTR